MGAARGARERRRQPLARRAARRGAALAVAAGGVPAAAAGGSPAEADLGLALFQVGRRAEGERAGSRRAELSFGQVAAEQGASQDYLVSGYKNGAPRGQISTNQWESSTWDNGACDFPRSNGENWRVCGPLATNNSQRDVFFRSGFYDLVWSMDTMGVNEFHSFSSQAVVCSGSLLINSETCLGPSDDWNADGKGYPIRFVRNGRYYAHYWVGGLQCGSYSATLEIKAWPDCFELYLASDIASLPVAIDTTLGAFSSSATGTGTADLGFCVSTAGTLQEKWASGQGAVTQPAATPADAGVGVCVDCVSTCGTTLSVARTIHWSWAGLYYYFCAYPESVQDGCPAVGTALTYASGVSIPSGVTFVTASTPGRKATHDGWCSHSSISGSQAYMIVMQSTATVTSWAWGTVFNLAGGDEGLPVSAAGAGWHVELPQGVSSSTDVNDNFEVVLSNNNPEPAVFRMLFHDDQPRGITGVAVFLRNHSSGEPSGFHVQISKNWHTSSGQEGLAPYDGMWLTTAVVLRVPAQSSLTMQLIQAYTWFNSLHSVSHAQLSLIGWGSNGHWEEVGLASGGESITYEPCAAQTRTTGGLDTRPFLTCGMNSAHGACDGSPESPAWTENHGGNEFLAVFSDTGSYEYLTEVETYHIMNGPKLTNASYTGTTVDNGIRRSVTASTWAADDMVRHLHVVRYEVMKDVTYPRFVAYHLGADFYSYVANPRFVYGDGTGKLADVVEVPTIARGRYYVNESWASCTVPPCWFALLSDPGTNRNAHRGLVVRRWEAKLGGAVRAEAEGPRFMLTDVGSAQQGLQLTLPEGFDGLQAGDYVEAELELFLYPNSSEVYFGTNPKMQSWLSDPDASWSVAYKEAVAGHLRPHVSVSAGALERAFPLRVRATSDQAQFQVAVPPDWPAVLPVTVCGVGGLGGRLFRWAAAGRRAGARSGGSWEPAAADASDVQVDREGSLYSVTVTVALGSEPGTTLDFAWSTDGAAPAQPPPTPAPTAAPTAAPTPGPTASPTPAPAAGPAPSPTPAAPTPAPAAAARAVRAVVSMALSGAGAEQAAWDSAPAMAGALGVPASEVQVTAAAPGLARRRVGAAGRAGRAPWDVSYEVAAASAEEAGTVAAALTGMQADPAALAGQLGAHFSDAGVAFDAGALAVGAPSVVEPQVPTPAPTDAVQAIDDPHLVSLSGKKFEVNMPGSYVLIRAPQDQRLPATLEVNASLSPFAGDPCGVYIQSVELSGQWLGDQVVRVVPLRRNVQGPNGAGNGTLRPFSVRVLSQRGDSHMASGAYEPWRNFRNRSRSLSGRVRLVPEWRQVYADAGRTQESQAFAFYIRGAGSGRDAALEVAQAAHQALNFRASGLRSLGFAELGGLLGTGGHEPQVERRSEACRAWRAAPASQQRVAAPGCMAASWD